MEKWAEVKKDKILLGSCWTCT